MAEASYRAWRNSPWPVLRSRMTASRSARTGWSTTSRRSDMGATITSRAACLPPMRNVELKARDPDPDRSLERALALGADDRGEITQRDTYFAEARGRLKLREQETGGSALWDELIEYSRADSSGPGTSNYRRVPIADAAALRDALDAALRNARDGYKAATAAALGGRAHPPRRGGGARQLPGARGGRPRPDSDLSGERDKVERLRRGSASRTRTWSPAATRTSS